MSDLRGSTFVNRGWWFVARRSRSRCETSPRIAVAEISARRSRSNGGFVGLAGANADNLLHAADEDFAVAYLARARGFDHSLDGSLDKFVGNNHLHLHFREKIHHILRSPV